MNDWIVNWPAGSTAGLTEEQAERLEKVLNREFGIAATRRRRLAPVEEFRERVRVPDEVLVEQVQRQVRGEE